MRDGITDKTAVSLYMRKDHAAYLEAVADLTGTSKSAIASKIFEAGVEKFDGVTLPELARQRTLILESQGLSVDENMSPLPSAGLWREVQRKEQEKAPASNLEEGYIEYIPSETLGGLGKFRPSLNPMHGFRCTGACGLLKPVNKFPTITRGPYLGYRNSECRSCAESRRQGLTHQ